MLRRWYLGESVAQSVEHNTFNVGVPGSSPGGFTSRRVTEFRNELCYFFYSSSLNASIRRV